MTHPSILICGMVFNGISTKMGYLKLNPGFIIYV